MKEYKADTARMWHLATRGTYESKDYAPLAVREMLQNSIDACIKAIENGEINEGKIDINWIKGSGAKFDLSVSDNGCGMIADGETEPHYCADLDDIYLNLGATDKTDGKTIGGLGIGKAVILGCADSWTIETRNTKASSYLLGQVSEWDKISYHQGCKISLYGIDYKYSTLTAIKTVIEASHWSSNIKVYFNGNLISEEVDLTEATRQFEFEDENVMALTNILPISEDDGYVIYRLRGLFQYKERFWDSRCLMVVDVETNLLPGTDEYPFTTSRESIRGPLLENISKIQAEIRNNEMATQTKDYDVFEFFITKGKKNATPAQEKTKMAVNKLATCMPSLKTAASKVIDNLSKCNLGTETINSIKESESFAHKAIYFDVNPLDIDWMIHRDTRAKYDPMKYDKMILNKLLFWDILCHAIATANGNVDVFRTGIAIKDDVNAEYLWYSDSIYLLFNPRLFLFDNDKRITLANMIRSASHEVAHLTYQNHNSGFVDEREAAFSHGIKLMNMLMDKAKIFDLLKET